MMAAIVRSSITAGVAIAGAGMWLATAHTAPIPRAPQVRLASVDVPLAPPPTDTCAPLCGLFGPG
jgi:hypothetical protein